MNGILQKIADNLLYGFVVTLKFLSPILLPLTLIYIFSIVLSQPYRFLYVCFRKLFNIINIKLKNRLNIKFNKFLSHSLSFGLIVLIFIAVVIIFGEKLGVELSRQYVSLGNAIHNHWGDIKESIKNYPIYKELMALLKTNFETVNFKDELGKLFNREFIGNFISAATQVKDFAKVIKDGAFSTVMQIVTWIVIPTLIHAIVTKPLKARDIYSLFPYVGKDVTHPIANIFIKFRDSLKEYFTKQLLVSILQIIILFLIFFHGNEKIALALAVTFGFLNLFPNFGSTLLILLSPIIASLFVGDFSHSLILVLFASGVLLIIDNWFSNFVIGKLSKFIHSWKEVVFIHPAIVTVSIIFWGFVLNGLYGLVLSIPLTIFLKTIMLEFKKKA